MYLVPSSISQSTAKHCKYLNPHVLSPPSLLPPALSQHVRPLSHARTCSPQWNGVPPQRAVSSFPPLPLLVSVPSVTGRFLGWAPPVPLCCVPCIISGASSLDDIASAVPKLFLPSQFMTILSHLHASPPAILQRNATPRKHPSRPHLRPRRLRRPPWPLRLRLCDCETCPPAVSSLRAVADPRPSTN